MPYLIICSVNLPFGIFIFLLRFIIHSLRISRWSVTTDVFGVTHSQKLNDWWFTADGFADISETQKYVQHENWFSSTVSSCSLSYLAFFHIMPAFDQHPTELHCCAENLYFSGCLNVFEYLSYVFFVFLGVFFSEHSSPTSDHILYIPFFGNVSLLCKGVKRTKWLSAI